jgi:peptidoglycan/LPS O-acetylase OafA/YrhL
MKRETLESAPHRHIGALDGMRGVALLLVLVMHYTNLKPITSFDQAFCELAHSCWLGVDFFFVLSGFLITGVLCDAKGKPHYFRNFYARRVLRILPVYYGFLFVLFFVVTEITMLDPISYRDLVRHEAWYWSFLVNFLVAGRGSWGPGSYWTSHLWSLSVEEQFYLLWPMIVAFIDRRRLAWGCLFVLVASPIARAAVLAHGADPEANSVYVYYSTLTRCDGLAAGALLALAQRSAMWLPVVLRWAKPAAIVALLVLVVTALFTGHLRASDPPVQVVGLSALAVLFGSVLALTLANSSGSLARLFATRPLRSLGRCSYAAYVIHFPIGYLLARSAFVPELFPRMAGSAMPGQMVVLVASVGVVWLLAAASFRFYEEPILRLKRLFTVGDESTRPAARVLAVFPLLPAAATILTHFARTDPGMRIALARTGVHCDSIAVPRSVSDSSQPIVATALFSGNGEMPFQWTTTGGELGSVGAEPNGPTLPGYTVLDSFDSFLLQPRLWTIDGANRMFVTDGVVRAVFAGPSDREAVLKSLFRFAGSFGLEVMVADLESGIGQAAVAVELTLPDGTQGRVRLLANGAARAVESSTRDPNGSWQEGTSAKVGNTPVRLQVLRTHDWLRFNYDAGAGFVPLGGGRPQHASLESAYVAIRVERLDWSSSTVIADLDNFGAASNEVALWKAPAEAVPGATYTLGIGGSCTARVTVSR